MATSLSLSQSAFDARSVGDWWTYNLATRGNPRHLAPGSYVWDEPLEASTYMGKIFPGRSPEWNEALGWMRLWHSLGKNAGGICSIGFDTEGWVAGTPCIKFTGCRGMTLSGVNLFRNNAGSLVFDENIDGSANSDGLTFERVGFGTRNDDDEGYDDPYDELAGESGFGVIDPNNTANRDGYYGVEIDATNGTDRYFFDRCAFMRLDTGYINYSDQTTTTVFNRCYWRFCDYKALIDDSPVYTSQTTGSGNISCYDCNSYDSGPFVYNDCDTQLSRFTWIGGYLDMIGDQQYQLVDAYNHSGILRITFDGAGKTHTGSHTDTNAFIRRRNGTEERTVIAGVNLASIPQGQRLFPGVTNTGFMMNPHVVSKAGAPSADDPDFDLDGMWGLHKNTSSGAIELVYNDAGTIKTTELTGP